MLQTKNKLYKTARSDVSHNTCHQLTNWFAYK